jgi:nitrite reductase/ring-hydroxylating ferredoxin subunit
MHLATRGARPVEEVDLERVLCPLSELDATGCREFRLGGGEWPARGFAVRAGTEVHAYLNRCAHLALPLNMLPDRFLTHDGSLILCTAHGALFEKRTGYCVAGPCAGAALERVAVRVVAGYVLLDDAVDVAALAERFA